MLAFFETNRMVNVSRAKRKQLWTDAVTLSVAMASYFGTFTTVLHVLTTSHKAKLTECALLKHYRVRCFSNICLWANFSAVASLHRPYGETGIE